MDILDLVVLLSSFCVLAAAAWALRQARSAKDLSMSPSRLIPGAGEPLIEQAVSTPLSVGASEDALATLVPPSARPALEIVPLADTRLIAETRVPLEPALGVALQPALGALASLATSFQHAGCYKISPSAELRDKLAGKAWEYMSGASDDGIRGIIVDSETKKILGIPDLKEVSSALLSATAVWQALSWITAQEFLARIDRQLGQLNERVGAIMSFLQAEERGRILGAIAYMLEVSKELPQTVLDVRYHNIDGRLEAIRHECFVLLETLGQRMSEHVAFVWPQASGPKSSLRDLQAADKAATEYGDCVARIDLVAKAYMVSCMLSSLLEWKYQESKGLNLQPGLIAERGRERLYALEARVRRFEDEARLVFETVARIGELKPAELLHRCRPGYAKRRASACTGLEDQGSRVLDTLSETRDLVRMQVDSLGQRLRAIAAPVDLYVTLDDNGDITSIERSQTEDGRGGVLPCH